MAETGAPGVQAQQVAEPFSYFKIENSHKIQKQFYEMCRMCHHQSCESFFGSIRIRLMRKLRHSEQGVL